MFTGMQRHRVVPASLARGLLTPLRKAPGKPLLRDCRPITLLEDPIKLFTKGLNNRIQSALRDHQETNDGIPLLSSLQFGFLFNSECLTALWPLLAALEDAKLTGKEIHILALDIKRAYDSIEFWSSEIAARRLRLPEEFIQIMREFDTNATTATRTPAGHTAFYPIERGMRQGDSLSPLRFILWMDMLLQEWSTQPHPYILSPRPNTPDCHLHAQAYVDDTLPISCSLAGIQLRLEVRYKIRRKDYGT